MKPIFADTSYYLAIVNKSDLSHDASLAFSGMHAPELVTTEYVLLELGNALSRRRLRPVFLRLLNRVQKDALTDVVPASSDLLKRGLALFRRRPDKDWSLTDCISFVVMRDRRIDHALTADVHFHQAGFLCLLR